MARKRLWAKFTLEFADHPKVAGLSDGAFRMLVEMILWSRQGLTDGFIPQAVAHRKWHTDSLTDSGSQSLTELLTNDERNPSLSEVGGGYLIHDFVEVQGSRESVERRTDTNRRNGNRGGRRKVTKSETESVTESEANGSAENREQRTEVTTTDVVVTSANDEASSEPPRPDVDELCQHLADRIEANGSKRPRITKTWRDAARLMLDRDQHPLDEIHRAIDWCQADEFWRANVLSMPKFREKWDQMRLQAARRNNDTPRLTMSEEIYLQERERAQALDSDQLQIGA